MMFFFFLISFDSSSYLGAKLSKRGENTVGDFLGLLLAMASHLNPGATSRPKTIIILGYYITPRHMLIHIQVDGR